MTRDRTGLSNRAQNPGRPEYRTYPATFAHVVRSSRILGGTVRDGKTGLPIEGVVVDARGPVHVNCLTDKDGKYKLVGLSRAKDYSVTF